MHVIINSDCDNLPQHSELLISEGTPLLNFFVCLQYNSRQPPLAPLLKNYYRLQGEWLILSPIQWQATHNDVLILAAGNSLSFSEVESRACFELFSDYLKADNIDLYYHDEKTWLMRPNKPFILKAKPPQHLLHQSLMSEIGELDSTLYWQKLITEWQMFLAAQAISFSINGLWPWGNGELPEKQAKKVCADEKFLPFARLCSSQSCLYQPSVSLRNQDILLLSDFSSLSKNHQEELKKIKVHWYWNNTAYITKKDNWLTHLWRKLIYAH